MKVEKVRETFEIAENFRHSAKSVMPEIQHAKVRQARDAGGYLLQVIIS